MEVMPCIKLSLDRYYADRFSERKIKLKKFSAVRDLRRGWQ